MKLFKTTQQETSIRYFAITIAMYVFTFFVMGCQAPKKGGTCDEGYVKINDDYCVPIAGQGDWPIKRNAKISAGQSVEGINFSYHLYGQVVASGQSQTDGLIPKSRGKLLLSVGDISLTPSPVWVGIVEYPIISPMSLETGLIEANHPNDLQLPLLDIEPNWLNALSSDAVNLNRTRFLQSLDADGDVSTGLQIDAASHNAARGRSLDFRQSTSAFTNDPQVTSYFQSMGKTLMSPEQAQINLENGLVKLYEGRYFTYSGFQLPDYTTGSFYTPLGRKMGLGITSKDVEDRCISSSLMFSYQETTANTAADTITLCFLNNSIPTVQIKGQTYAIKRYGINKVALFVAEADNKQGGSWHIVILTLPDGNLAYRTFNMPNIN